MTYLDVQNTIFDGGKAEETLHQVNHARQLGQSIASGDTAAAQSDALNLVTSDVSEIRQSLAFELRLAETLPQDLAKTIATSQDPDVAGPFLEASPVVTEDFALEVVGDIVPAAQPSLARRPDMTDVVAKAIVDCGTEKALLSLARNEKADIAPDTLSAIAARFPDSERLSKSVQQAKSRAGEVAHEPKTEERKLPFNVLISRARAFRKNGMLTSSYLEACITDRKVEEFEAGLVVLTDLQRKDVRKALLTSHETRRELEQVAGLLPGALSSNDQALFDAYQDT